LSRHENCTCSTNKRQSTKPVEKGSQSVDIHCASFQRVVTVERGLRLSENGRKTWNKNHLSSGNDDETTCTQHLYNVICEYVSVCSRGGKADNVTRSGWQPTIHMATCISKIHCAKRKCEHAASCLQTRILQQGCVIKPCPSFLAFPLRLWLVLVAALLHTRRPWCRGFIRKDIFDNLEDWGRCLLWHECISDLTSLKCN